MVDLYGRARVQSYMLSTSSTSSSTSSSIATSTSSTRTTVVVLTTVFVLVQVSLRQVGETRGALTCCIVCRRAPLSRIFELHCACVVITMVSWCMMM